MTHVDFVIATHNRSGLLARALQSFTTLRVPAGYDFRVTVVANNCSDDTVPVVQQFAESCPFAVRALVEPVPGKSAALNTGVAACDAEWIAFIDDDERIMPDWLEVFAEASDRLRFDFAGGRYLADFETSPPDWLPRRQLAAVIACHDDDVRECQVRPEHSLVWGGNFIVRREALVRTGPFDVDFARHDSLLALGCEDADMVRRLLAGGHAGWFVPAMQIYHWAPNERLTRPYFRQKIYGHGYNQRRYEQARVGSPLQGPRFMGLPRWRWRVAVRSVAAWCRTAVTGPRDVRFAHELELWSVAGYLRAVREGH